MGKGAPRLIEKTEMSILKRKESSVALFLKTRRVFFRRKTHVYRRKTHVHRRKTRATRDKKTNCDGKRQKKPTEVSGTTIDTDKFDNHESSKDILHTDTSELNARERKDLFRRRAMSSKPQWDRSFVLRNVCVTVSREQIGSISCDIGNGSGNSEDKEGHDAPEEPPGWKIEPRKSDIALTQNDRCIVTNKSGSI